MTRKDYLELHWKKYPEMPAKSLCYGRIQAVLNDKLELLRQSEILSVELDLSLHPQCFFQVGDLVAQTEKKDWILLAPSIKKASLGGQLVKSKIQETNPELLKLWSLYLTKVRSYFVSQNFIEVQTPSLVSCPGTEPALEAFKTEFVFGDKKQTLYLPTSPELNLKKALSQGLEKIFEIRSCFRNSEITERHQSEFMMIEWYRAFANLNSIREDVISLIQFLNQDSELIIQFQKCSQTTMNAPRGISIKTVRELFEEQKINLHPQMNLQNYKDLLSKTQLKIQGDLTIDDCFFLLMGELIEPNLNGKDLVFVEQYPPFQAALARMNEEGWGERFEVYWQGLEIANAFHELNDPTLQREQAHGDLSKKKSEGKTAIPLDEDFFSALDFGIPPSGGIALGLDRLFMALFQFEDIRVGKLFSYNFNA